MRRFLIVLLFAAFRQAIGQVCKPRDCLNLPAGNSARTPSGGEYRGETFSGSSSCLSTCIRPKSFQRCTSEVGGCYESVCVDKKLYLQVGPELQPCTQASTGNWEAFFNAETPSRYAYVSGPPEARLFPDRRVRSAFQGYAICNSEIVACCSTNGQCQGLQRREVTQAFTHLNPVVGSAASADSDSYRVSFCLQQANIRPLLSVRDATTKIRNRLILRSIFATYTRGWMPKAYAETIANQFGNVSCFSGRCVLSYSLPPRFTKPDILSSGRELAIKVGRIAFELQLSGVEKPPLVKIEDEIPGYTISGSLGYILPKVTINDNSPISTALCSRSSSSSGSATSRGMLSLSLLSLLLLLPSLVHIVAE